MSTNGAIKVLAVDDEQINLEILEDDLKLAGYDVLCAEDGQKAWDILLANPDIRVILLDRMMPVMDGMEFIQQLKENESLKHIPVIMQTGAALRQQVIEGIAAGVYYYLTKPYDEALLLAVVAAAIDDARKASVLKGEVEELQVNLDNFNLGLKSLCIASFEFATLEDVKGIAFILANSSSDSKKTILGISEIMQNAVEHGNLGITFEEKSKLLVEGNFQAEVLRRLELAEYKDKKASVEIKRYEDRIEITVSDEGKGFDSGKYLDLAPERATLPNGRGIAMANMFSFDGMEYIGCGNKVVCHILIN